MLLASIFDALPDLFRSPFGFELPSSRQFPELGEDLCPLPVATFQIQNTELIFRLSLPLGASTPSAHSAQSELSPGGLPERQPDSPSLPASVSDLVKFR